MANDELMRLAERLRLAASAPDSPRRIEGIAADLRALAQRAPQNGAVPEGWRTQVEKALARAKVFDDGSDGADGESAQSVVAILSGLLAAAPAPEAERAEGDDFTGKRIEQIDGEARIVRRDRGRFVSSVPASAGQPEGAESDLLLSVAVHLCGQADRDEREAPFDGDGPATLRHWARQLRRLASAQRAGKDGA